MKHLLMTAACVVGLSLSAPMIPAFAAYDSSAGLSDEQKTVLAAHVEAIEALVIQYKDDPDGLQAAIEAYLENAEDPLLAAKALISVAEDSENAEVAAILNGNPAIKAALGAGLGAAVAVLGLTNPDLATQILAEVSIAGDEILTASVTDGNQSKTASLNSTRKTQDGEVNKDTTPENPASAS
jgi:hypothetical protein